MQQRYYDPIAGRFLSVDPVVTDANTGKGFGLYTYVDNNPCTKIDPDGREPESKTWAHPKGMSDDERRAANVTAGKVVVGGLAVAGTAMALAPVAVTALAVATDTAATGSLTTGLLANAPAVNAAAVTVAEVAAANTGVGYVVSPNGTAFPVPKGAQGPTPVINQAGKQTGVAFTGGAGGKNKQVATMCIMDPTQAKGNSPGYPNGYVKYEDANGQGVDPLSGKLPNSQIHFPVQ